jgi:hypothetical protein
MCGTQSTPRGRVLPAQCVASGEPPAGLCVFAPGESQVRGLRCPVSHRRGQPLLPRASAVPAPRVSCLSCEKADEGVGLISRRVVSPATRDSKSLATIVRPPGGGGRRGESSQPRLPGTRSPWQLSCALRAEEGEEERVVSPGHQGLEVPGNCRAPSGRRREKRRESSQPRPPGTRSPWQLSCALRAKNKSKAGAIHQGLKSLATVARPPGGGERRGERVVSPATRRGDRAGCLIG